MDTLFFLLGLMTGATFILMFVQTKATRTIIYAKYLYPYVEIEEVKVETSVVMPNVKGIVNDPQVQNAVVNVASMVIVMMIALEAIVRIKL